MAPPNALYAQSGGVTAVINASACGVIETARRHPRRIGRMLAARNGILGLLSESLVDTGSFANDQLIGMRNTPGGIFGSCRFDLDEERDNPAQYDRIFEVLATHRVGYLFYNGGNGSMRTARQIAESALRRDYPLVVVGIPKTVDNDIVETDCCPGYGSAIKYLATSMREASIDLASMSTRRGRVFVLEVMGRNAGWLAAGCGLAADREDAAPHLVLLPEVTFDEARVLAAIKTCVARLGYCAIAVAEGVRSSDGKALAQVATDPAGYVQLGGRGPSWRAGSPVCLDTRCIMRSVITCNVQHAILFRPPTMRRPMLLACSRWRRRCEARVVFAASSDELLPRHTAGRWTRCRLQTWPISSAPCRPSTSAGMACT